MFTRIKPPKYRIGRCILNEYELRTLMAQVAKGEKPFGQKVKDQKGITAIIQENGALSHTLFGLAINSEATLQILRYRNK